MDFEKKLNETLGAGAGQPNRLREALEAMVSAFDGEDHCSDQTPCAEHARKASALAKAREALRGAPGDLPLQRRLGGHAQGAPQLGVPQAVYDAMKAERDAYSAEVERLERSGSGPPR
jgi:hypothetical protein